ncbi:uncharacterized protein LOC128712410 [Anopheles marshallii]|uniref:uncharacterized protein LOC128712410 n=1 Tax=Anopheles marshallii TaxID=1521116 RepID=UPI00237B677A|nr:uncharacterized protein LOC128712410 [Anopheles marshallii]
MASKITKIKELNPQQNHPVILENFGTYLEHRQHAMKCLLAHDRSSSTVSEDVGNVLLVSGEKEIYYGNIKVNPAAPDQPDLLHTFVARRNRTTGKIRLFEVRSSTLTHISHDSPSYDQPNEAMNERQMKNLQRKFNPRLAYLLEKKSNSRIDLSVMEGKLESMLAETVVKDVEESCTTKITVSNDDLQQELHAKANPNAKTLANLYEAQKVIGADVWRSLTESAKKLVEMPVEYFRMANSYLETKVKAVMQSNEPTTEPNLAIVRTCIYMDVLVRLTGRKAYQLTKKNRSISSFTKLLDGPIRQNFLQRVQSISNTSDQVTKYTRKKALLYYLALVFALEGCDAVDMNLIHQSLEVPRNEITMYGNIVGARYNAKQDQFTIGTFRPKTEENQANDLLEMLKGPQRGNRLMRK